MIKLSIFPQLRKKKKIFFSQKRKLKRQKNAFFRSAFFSPHQSTIYVSVFCDDSHVGATNLKMG